MGRRSAIPVRPFVLSLSKHRLCLPRTIDEELRHFDKLSANG
jgi:hypothetical protein